MPKQKQPPPMRLNNLLPQPDPNAVKRMQDFDKMPAPLRGLADEHGINKTYNAIHRLGLWGQPLTPPRLDIVTDFLCRK